MATLIISKKTGKGLVNIREELYNPDAAARIIKALRQSIDALKNLPERGTPLDTILPVHTNYRYLVCEKYCIFYLCDDSTIEVVRIHHQLQHYMSALFAN